MTDLSILDLVSVREGTLPAQALRESLAFAQHADSLGCRRYWVAEHHNMIGIASAATSVVIGYLAGGTQSIRVGAGGIMLPNHSPLQVAEQFGTLESLYPGRIDLGLGRAPGTDQLTAQAMRRDLRAAAERFPDDVVELRTLFEHTKPNQTIQAVPGSGLNVPMWILGSSLFGAQLAAQLGLPYAFASHFAPDLLDQALSVYRDQFKPSPQLDKPHAMPCVNVIVAESDEQAAYCATSVQQMFVNMIRAQRGLMPAPIDDIEAYWSPVEKLHVESMLACTFVGSSETVDNQLSQFMARTNADELMVNTPIFDQHARHQSLSLLTEIGVY